jgi:DeoR family transcriptional regulator of aga operon
MTLLERHSIILELLREFGKVDVADLSSKLKVSAVTIRKDLDLLEEKKLLYRTHGGAILADPYIATRKVSEKEKLRPEVKRRIGLKAVELLSPQDALIIASGTTVQAFARCIENMKLTVITSAMNVAMELLDKPDIEIIQLGGIIRHSSASAVSEYAIRMLDNFCCSKLFLGVDGIDPEYGLSTTHIQEACLNQAMIAAATKTIVLADSSKFGRRGFSKICNMSDIDWVITDSGISPKMLEAIEEQGVKVTIVPLPEA